MQSAKLHILSSIFFIPPIFCVGNMYIKFGLLIKEDIWYVVLISNFKRYKVCITSFVYKTWVQSKEIRKVDAVTSFLRKITNSIKFEPLLRFRPY